jgi:WD40 repeat protein
VADPGFSSFVAADAAEDPSPFQGLGFYTEADAKWFFGRMTERKIILSHLRTARLTLLYAESGVGKSSLLRAGVAARLRELAGRGNGAGRSPKFIPVVFSAWKDDPVEDLIAEIERHVDPRIADVHRQDDLRDGNGSALAAAIARAASSLDATLVIILDQFEEHFSYRAGAERPDLLADELAHCINSPEVRAHFLIAVREDAYGRLGDLFGGRIGNVYSNYLHLEYLTRDAGREAIEQPVAVYNTDHPEHEPMALEPDLADAVLEEVRRGNLELGARRPELDGGSSWLGVDADAIETPFLQLVMSRMWEWERAHGSPVLRRATLDGELGGAEAIVRNHVSHALAGLAGEELEAATDFFRALVTPSGAKVAHTAADLAKMTGHAEITVASVVSRLYEERILRAVDPAPGTTQARYEIFHDRLAAPILDWREEQENARLKQAAFRAERDAETQRTQARRFKRRARVMLALALGLLILLVAVIVSLKYARDQSATARREQRAAVRQTAAATSYALTTRADSQLSSRPDVSLLLDLAAYAKRPRAVAARSLAATLEAVQGSGAAGVLNGHTGAVESVAFSPAGGLLASASSDRTIRFWKVTPGAHYPLGHPLRADSPQYTVAFAPDGQTLASGGFDEVILWNVRRRTRERTLSYLSGAVTSVAFSRRGNALAAGGSNGTVLLWNPVTGARRVLPVSGGRAVRSVALSPDGKVLAVGTSEEVALFDVASGRELGQPLKGPTASVYTVAFSPDGRTLAAAGSSGTVVLWNTVTHTSRLLVPEGHNPINSVALSPDGHGLAVGGEGTTAGTTTVWSLANHGQPATGVPLAGHHGAADSVAFSPNSAMLASGGADGTIVLWRYPLEPRSGVPLVVRNDAVKSVAISPDGRLIASGDHGGAIWISRRTGGPPVHVLRAHAGQVNDLRFDPTGRILAAAYGDGTIGLWDASTGTPDGQRLRGDAGFGAVNAIAFNQSGTMLASGSSDGIVRLWDMRRRTQLGPPLAGNFGTVYTVAFSPDGAIVAAGGQGRVIRLWQTRTRAPLHPPLISEDDAVFSLAFAPRGLVLAAGAADDTIHLWRIGPHTDTLVRTLTGDSGYIRSVAFSPDGTTLASGSTDNTVRLWDVANGTELGSPLPGDTRSVEKVAFSSDGGLVTGSSDRAVRLWQALPTRISFAALRAEVCGFVGAGLSRAEWSEYAPGIPFRRTCSRTTPS